MAIHFGSRSTEIRHTLCLPLQRTVVRAGEICPEQFDMSLIEGHRSVERQQKLHSQGLTTIDGITKLGKHNYNPSKAVDVYPYDATYGVLTGHSSNVDYICKLMKGNGVSSPNERKIEMYIRHRFYIQAGILMTAASSIGVKLRWGGDWNSNGNLVDQSFNDLPHFELAS